MSHISRLILHGTGAGTPSGDRGASSASLIFSDGSAFVIDAGEGCSRAMLRDGLTLNNVLGVAVSHTHADHWAGLPNLVMGWALSKRVAPVDLYLPPGSIDFFKTVFQTSWLLPERLGFPVNFHTLSPVDLPDGWHLRPFRTTHLDNYREVGERLAIPWPAFGYVLEKENRKIIFSQDLGSENDLIPELSGAELVICEIAHVNSSRFLLLAKRAGVGRVVFTHVPPDLPSLPAPADASGDGMEWSLAVDGMTLAL